MKVVKIGVFIVTGVVVALLARRSEQVGIDLPNRMPEAAPYVTEEAKVFPPPYEEYWKTQNNPGQCQTCHTKIFDEWNGSQMANSWRDPVWRGAYLLLVRLTSTNGNCDLPQPPDGTERAVRNPFAKGSECASTFNIGNEHVTLSRPGSLLDAFCSRCHMPTNYLDNHHPKDIVKDADGNETARPDPNFNPTGDNGTGIAFATLDSQFRNTETGKTGIFCAICHTMGATRDTPFHNYERTDSDKNYTPALGTASRNELMAADKADMMTPADPSKTNLGYSIGAGAYRLSPHAIVFPERFGPLFAQDTSAEDANTSGVFGQSIPFQHMDASKHKGYGSAMFVRSEMCGTCHDVTNALPIKNTIGRWAGGFPIERTYTEWTHSRYADRPGNTNYDPKFKRDCQSCHMQQDYGQPGTAQTLYDAVGHPLPIPMEPVANDGPVRPKFTHHFVGGNALVPRLIGKDVDNSGNVSPYPELSSYSFSSADHKSPYSRAVWTHLERKGAYAQQTRMAWDRLRHVIDLQASGPATANAGDKAPINISVQNTGSGHNFPTGFPEGRVAWIAVHAYDLSTGKELMIHDSTWNKDFRGVGNLTTEEIEDPNFPKCKWEMPIGSPDPFAVQFKAVASIGDGCPTLDLVYATPLNLKVNADNMPIDKDGKVVEARHNPKGLEVFEDKDGDGDLFDDSFLTDTRLRPMPNKDSKRTLDGRYSVIIPPGTKGPVVVSTGLYYQSVEAIVAQKFLGNMIDTNNNMVIEPCVLGGRCDGRKPHVEPAVVEGSPPVPMSIKAVVININGAQGDTSAPRVGVYPTPGENRAYLDVVPKVFFSRPVTGVTKETFTMTDSTGAQVPAWVDPIGDGTWGLFSNSILLKAGETYTAHLAAGICDAAAPDRCTKEGAEWSFTLAADADSGEGDTGVPMGFSGANGPQPPLPGSPESKAIKPGPNGPVKTAGATPTPAPAAAPGTPAPAAAPGKAAPATPAPAPNKSASTTPAKAPAAAATIGAATR